MQSSRLNSSILVQHTKYIGGNMHIFKRNALSLPLNCVMGVKKWGRDVPYRTMVHLTQGHIHYRSEKPTRGTFRHLGNMT
jgi:hypothetical protein